MSSTAADTEYVTRELFDLQIKHIEERANLDRELTNERMDKLQAVMEKNFATVNGRIDVIEEKLEHVTDTLTVAINGVDKRIDDLDKRIDDIHQSQTLWFTVFGILIAVVPIAVAVVQSFLK